MKTATMLFCLGMGVSIITTEVARTVVDKRRKHATGMGGTQDINLIGMLVTLICLSGAVICGIAWNLGH